jgi:uncharacterized membrane protein YphA (DoxX/SURF4 family)
MLRDRFATIPILLVAVSWITAFLFRPYMGLMIAAGELAMIGPCLIKARHALANSLALTLGVVTCSVSLVSGWREVQNMYGEAASLQGAEQKRIQFAQAAAEERERGRQHSEYIIDLRAATPLQSVLQLPIRIPLFLLSPIPVRFGSLLLMATYPEMLFLYCLIPFLIRGLAHGWRREPTETLFVLAAIAPILVAFSVGTSLSGEAMRYRDILLPQLLLFVAVGWSLRRTERRGLPAAVISSFQSVRSSLRVVAPDSGRGVEAEQEVLTRSCRASGTTERHAGPRSQPRWSGGALTDGGAAPF